jgi:hypothetical protein
MQLWGFGRDGVSTDSVQGATENIFSGRKQNGTKGLSDCVALQQTGGNYFFEVVSVSDGLIGVTLFVLGIIAVIRFWPWLKAIDARIRARHEADIRDRTDQVAHFRHTLALAEEQVEAVTQFTASDERTGTPVTRFLFEGETFASQADAKRVREERVRALARGFYMDLPAALAARKDGRLN